MTVIDTTKSEIIALETKPLELETRQPLEILNRLIAEDFIEIGSSEHHLPS